MKAKSSAKSDRPGTEKLARAEKEMNEARLSARQAKLDVKRAKKAAKEARKRFKSARKVYKTLLKGSGGRDKNAAAGRQAGSDKRKRLPVRKEIPLPAALLPQVSRKATKASAKPAKRAPAKVVPEPSGQPETPQISPTPEDIPVGLLPQNPSAPDLRPPSP